ncbi:MAG: hypothetical protein JSR58_03490 [Verrucomicrobia bacterium]|nr:hypothetical protein [Verrucomicrobiota bacterium]
MAAISSTPSAFTKAFLVRHEKYAARAEFCFDKARGSLTLNRLNYWESKEIVHLTYPLADDSLPSFDTVTLYYRAAELALEWRKKFPTEEKNPDNTYKVIPWNAEITFIAHSPEEAFLYWMLFYFMPKENEDDFVEILRKGQSYSKEQNEFMANNAHRMQALGQKVRQGYVPNAEERKLVDQFRFVLPQIDNVHSDPKTLKKMLEGFRKLKFPQIMCRPENDDIEITVQAAKVELTKRAKAYESALEKRPSKTKIQDID